MHYQVTQRPKKIFKCLPLSKRSQHEMPTYYMIPLYHFLEKAK